MIFFYFWRIDYTISKTKTVIFTSLTSALGIPVNISQKDTITRNVVEVAHHYVNEVRNSGSIALNGHQSYMSAQLHLC